MKRSEINGIMKDAEAFIGRMKFNLPGFACWSPDDWKRKGPEYNEIRDNMLGWDITDFGSGDYRKIGLLLFTIRNGNFKIKKYIKPYAEKLMIVGEGQITPYHFHWKKMEDIINRGGGNLMVKVYNATGTGRFAASPVAVSLDGRNYKVKAGTVIRVTPGESITLPAGQYHSFWGEPGAGEVLLGEVSMVNDDRGDNRFYEPVGRFTDIEEDVKPRHLLCNEYPAAKK